MAFPVTRFRQASVGLLFMSLLSGAVSATTFTPGDNAALRDALITAATNGVDDVIDLSGQTFVLNSALIIAPENALLEIRNGTLERTVGGPLTRLVEVSRTGTAAVPDTSNIVSFTNVTFRNGRVDVGDTSSNVTGGGAILGNWNIKVEGSRFENNAVVGNGSGGAILSSGQLNVFNSVFINNSALSSAQGTAAFGGAIIVKQQGFQLENNSFTGNSANAGGALYFTASSSNSSFVGGSFFDANNATTLGGAIFSGKSRLVVLNSTLVGNTAGTGGAAIYSQGRGITSGDVVNYGLQVRFSALIGNQTNGGSGGGGILAEFSRDTGVSLLSTILGSNTGGNCAVIGGSTAGFTGNFVTNIVDDSSCGEDIVDDDKITFVGNITTLFSGDLAQNGGPTPTFALATDSIAVDASSALCELFDQRGVRRPSGGFSRPDLGEFCDIGPFELEGNDSDSDGDGIADFVDNCPDLSNQNQADLDEDGFGDACDVIDNRDDDGDEVENFEDNCIADPNTNQLDSDSDGEGDACDLTPTGDSDDDGVDDGLDNCRSDSNPDQKDTDGDGAGDVCDVTPNGDTDNDLVDELEDNCPTVANPNQLDTDEDGFGDLCDDTPTGDSDGDGLSDNADNCPVDANPDQADTDEDGVGNACDLTPNGDTDNDGIDNTLDNCPVDANPDQSDTDGDGIGDACEVPDNTGGDGINTAVSQAADELDRIIAGSNRSTSRRLKNAARQLYIALRNHNWTAENELSDRRGVRVFSNVGNALNQIEKIADARRVSPALKAELDAVSTALLDNLRLLAENRITQAETADGNSRKIKRARNSLIQADNDRRRDWLRSAARRYGTAWNLAKSAH